MRELIWVLVPQYNLGHHQTLSIYAYVGFHVTSLSLPCHFLVYFFWHSYSLFWWPCVIQGGSWDRHSFLILWENLIKKQCSWLFITRVNMPQRTILLQFHLSNGWVYVENTNSWLENTWFVELLAWHTLIGNVKLLYRAWTNTCEALVSLDINLSYGIKLCIYTFGQLRVRACGHSQRRISPFQNSKMIGYRWQQCWVDGLGWHMTLFYLQVYN